MSEHQHAKTLKTTDNAMKQKAHINRPVSQHTHPAAIIQQVRTAPRSLRPAHVLQLQRTIGNRAVAQLISETGGLASAEQIPIQRQMPEEEKEPLQSKLASGLTGTLLAKTEASHNKTGMSDHLKSGL